MGRGEIESLLEPVVVWKEDTETVRHLGLAFLRTCEVERWKRVGRGDRPRWSPAAWRVPRFRLAGHSPLSKEEIQREHTQPESRWMVPALTHRVTIDIVPEHPIRLFGYAPRRSCVRLASLFRGNWDRLPDADRKKMLGFLYERREGMDCLLGVKYEPTLHDGTSAMFWPNDGYMSIDSRAMQASTDARVKAIIAHELGHLRSFCDPDTDQSDIDEREAEANRYAEHWGYPCVANFHKTDECDDLQKIAHQAGMKWRIFYAQTEWGENYYTCLRPGERFGVDHVAEQVGDDFEDARRYLKYRSERMVRSKGLAKTGIKLA